MSETKHTHTLGPWTMEDTMTVLERLREIVTMAGSQEKAARKLGLSPAYLGELLRGTRQPGPKVLSALGLRKETVYTEDKQ